jgi:patatin-like phospholipase/acyl hydrolase
LAAIEKRSALPLVNCFDLITGTSTGGILAIGLALRRHATELVDFYKREAENIFPPTGILGGLARTARQLVAGPKHESERLRDVLDRYFGERRLGEAGTRLVVTSYNASRDGAHLFKTYHHTDLYKHYKFRAADIALATAAAPLYFEGTELPLGDNGEAQIFLDGGIWANAPTLVGLTEAVRYMGAQISEIHMLSVGTGYKPFSITKKQVAGGVAQWGLALKDLLLGAQQASAVGTAKTILGDRFKRIQKVLEKDVSMDDPVAVDEMIEFGTEDGKNECEEVVRQFCDSAVEPFVPIAGLIS